MSLPYRRCGRRKSSMVDLTITPTGVPDFVIPVRRCFQQSETSSVQSSDSQQPTGLQAVRARGRISSPRPNESTGGSMTPTSQFSSTYNSSFSNSSLGFSPAPSILPNDYLRRFSEEAGLYWRSSTDQPVVLEPRRHHSVDFDKDKNLTREIGSPAELPKKLLPPWLPFPRFNICHLNTFRSRANNPSSMQCFESEIFKQSQSGLWSISNSNWNQAAVIPQTTIPHMKLKVLTEAKAEETKPEDSIKISLSYKPHDKTLTGQIHGLTCVDPKGGSTRDLMVELSLSSGKQRRVLGVSKDVSAGEALSKTAVFDGVRSVCLLSASLAVSVYTKGLIRKRGQLLYQACTPLLELPLTGHASWVSLTNRKATGRITICMSYLTCKSKLMVTVASAKALKKSTLGKASYVEVNLFRGSGKQSKMETVRTKARYGGRNPVFKEAFSLELPSKGLASVYTELSFTVRRRNLIRDDEVLGRVTLSSEMLLRWKKSQSLTDTLDEVFRYPGKVITQTHPLLPS